jgi:probable addiction module antidote protein
MKRKYRDYQETLLQDLKNQQLAQAYLNVMLQEEDPAMFLIALRDVCDAQRIGMTDLAAKTNLSRENLYRILSKKGNPKLNNIISVLHAVGLTLSVNTDKKNI